MNKILILTTEGCEACSIASCNIESAILQANVDIEKEVKDWHDEKREVIIANKVKDFPTVLYYIDDKVIKKAVGTYPSAVYLRWIDMYFKN